MLVRPSTLATSRWMRKTAEGNLDYASMTKEEVIAANGGVPAGSSAVAVPMPGDSDDDLVSVGRPQGLCVGGHDGLPMFRARDFKAACTEVDRDEMWVVRVTLYHVPTVIARYNTRAEAEEGLASLCAELRAAGVDRT